MKATLYCLSCFLLGLGGLAGAQQSPWQIEARAGTALPVEDLGDIELGSGASLSATLAFQLSESISAYGGWGWHLLDTERTDATPGGAVEETGYVLGLSFESPINGTGLTYRLHGGATYEHIELEDDDGDVFEDSGHGTGFELGAAIVWPLGGQLSLIPGLRYRSLSRDLTLGGSTSSETLNFISTEVGLAWRF